MHCYADSSADSDYSSLSMSLTFFPGDTVGSPPHCVTFTILDDEVVEASEAFAVTLSSSSVVQVIGIASIHINIYEDPSDCRCMHAIVHE